MFYFISFLKGFGVLLLLFGYLAGIPYLYTKLKKQDGQYGINIYLWIMFNIFSAIIILISLAIGSAF